MAELKSKEELLNDIQNKLRKRLKRKGKEPILWDRLFLVIFGNIILAMAFIEAMAQEWAGAIFGLSCGIVIHLHYWRGGRFLLKLHS